jgi:Domain of unknown function (DUF4743)
MPIADHVPASTSADLATSVVHELLDRVRQCNSYDLANYLPFVVDGITVGHVRKSLADGLARFRNIFVVRPDSIAMTSDLRRPC